MKTSTQIVVGIGVGIATTGAVVIGRECCKKNRQTSENALKDALRSKDIRIDRLMLRLEDDRLLEQHLESILTSLTRERDSCAANARDLSAELNLLKGDQTATKQAYARDKRRLRDYLRRQHVLENRVECLQAEKDEFKSQSRTLGLLRDNAAIRIGELQKRVGVLTADRDALAVQVGEGQADIVELGAVNAETVQQFHAAHAQADALQIAQNALAVIVANLQAELVAAAHVSGIVTQERDALAIRVAELEVGVADLEAVNTQIVEQLHYAQGQGQALHLELEQAQHERQGLTDQVHGLQGQIDNLSNVNAATNQQLHKLQNDADRFSHESDHVVRGLQGQVHELRFALATITRERDGTYNECHQLQLVCDGLSQHNGELQATVRGLQAQAAALTTDCNRAVMIETANKMAAQTASANVWKQLQQLQVQLQAATTTNIGLKNELRTRHVALDAKSVIGTAIVEGSPRDRNNSTSTLDTTMSSLDSSPPANPANPASYNPVPQSETEDEKKAGFAHSTTLHTGPASTNQSYVMPTAAAPSAYADRYVQSRSDTASPAPQSTTSSRPPVYNNTYSMKRSDTISPTSQFAAPPTHNAKPAMMETRVLQDVREEIEGGWVRHHNYNPNEYCLKFLFSGKCEFEEQREDDKRPGGCCRFHTKPADLRYVKNLVKLQKSQSKPNTG